MNIYLMYAFILILTLLLFIIVKDKIKALKLTGILTMTSSFLLIIMIFIIKFIVNTSITNINVLTITNYIFLKFVNTSLILFVIGIIEILVGKYIYAKKVTQ